MKIKKILTVLAGAVFLGTMFISCTNELEIKKTDKGTFFKYKAGCGPTFIHTIEAITGEEDVQIFNAEDIKSIFSQTGVEQLDVVETGKTGFIVSGKLAEDKSDMISQSGMLETSGKGVRLVTNAQKMQKLYDDLPKELSYYIDLFMSPSFTGEKMTNEEYADLIAAVYGEEMADEIKNSKVNISLIREDGTTKKFSVSLMQILNLTGTLAFTN